MYLVGQSLCQLLQQTVFMMSDWDVFVFRSIRDNLHQSLDLGLVVEGYTEQLWNKDKVVNKSWPRG